VTRPGIEESGMALVTATTGSLPRPIAVIFLALSSGKR